MSRSCFGIIAGNGRYPLLLAEELVKSGITIAVASFDTETMNELKPAEVYSHPVIGRNVKAAESFRVGQVDALFSFLASAGVSEFFLAGGIDRKGLWSRIRPDMTAVKIALKSGISKDDHVLRLFADQGIKHGLSAGDPRPYIESLILTNGRSAGPEVDSDQKLLIEKAASALEEKSEDGVGQAAVAWGGGVIMETSRGTDSLLEEYAAANQSSAENPAVLVKLPRPGQDLRFDMPAIGPGTVRGAAESGVRVIAGRAGQTLFLDAAEACTLADESGITILGL